MKPTSSRRGVALVIVLGFLVLLSGLAIAFFSSVTTELSASRTYASNVTTRQLSDSAINLVMGQIREATARPGGAWASQPGMIRVYRDGSTPPANHSPKADAFFKLYSARNMVVESDDQISSFDPGAAPYTFTSDPNGDRGDVPSDWDKYPGLFTDLNSPVMVTDPAKPGSAAKPVFPILDPRAKEEVNGEPLVEGFDFSPDVNKAVDSGSPDSWRVPMPVRWIYVLRDGTLTVPQKEYSASGGGTGAEWTSTSSDFRTPSNDNPIVGRIAFWADDDTSKININTAGGHGMQTQGGYTDGYNVNSYAGAFWDTPRVYTNFDIGQTDPRNGKLLLGVGAGGLAATQPFQREFQRYPGHPATTSLGAVFARLLTSDQIYQLTPRLDFYDPSAPPNGLGGNNTGGSRGGTARFDIVDAVLLRWKRERLYASLDELLYSAKPVNGGQRVTNDDYIGASGGIAPDQLEKMKFFLTAHSRSPDLNLFGRPRVTIWPVADDERARSALDRAIEFCSNVGGQKFIFTRVVSNSGALSTKMDITSNAYSRNPDLMKYLRELTSKAIPGFGGNFQTKYGVANRDAILGQIFDYIRIANLQDGTVPAAYKYARAGVVAPSREDIFGTGQKIGGFGRCATISEATIVFYCSGVSTDGNTFVQTEIPEPQKAGISHRQIKAFVFFSTFDPMQGYAPVVAPNRDEEKQVFEVTGLDSFTIDGQPMGFPSTARNSIDVTSGQTWAGRNFAGYEGFMHTMAGHHTNYEFASTIPVKVAIAQQNFTFSGGKLEVKIKFGPNLIQTVNMEFPPGSWPLPERWYRISQGGFVSAGQTNYNVTSDKDNGRKPANIEQPQNLFDFSGSAGPMYGRIRWVSLHANNPATTGDYAGEYAGDRWRQIVQPGDIVRSLVYGSYSSPPAATKDGDLRFLALTDNVASTEFRKHPDYDSSLRFAAGLRAADGSVYYQTANLPCWKVDAPAGQEKSALVNEPVTAFGKHVSSAAALNISKGMALPMSKLNPPTSGVQGISRSDGRAGDFDTGLGNFPDGPYAGKQDEGNVVFKYFDQNIGWVYPIPYASTQAYTAPLDIFFSPNRQMPSPGLFGSLLSRPKDQSPRRQWETLAFCPNTAGERHPGNTATPRDHLLLDLFHMPFVEPYLISEPLSTAGRVNLNFQIAPFGYIKRSTGLRGALYPLRVSAIESARLSTYKTGRTVVVEGVSRTVPLDDVRDNIRFAINRDETIKALEEPGGFFDQYKSDPNKGFFKSATEFCERFLYPIGVSVNPKFKRPIYDPVTNTSGESDMLTFWRGRTLTGDNVREKPYSDLYPRITTKSNTYTVHLRVQTIRQVGVGGDFKKWQEGRDVVLGEYRGATTVERYIDPSDPRLPAKVDKSNTDPTKQSLEDLYRFRVVDTKKFTP